MIKLYGNPHSRANRVRWALECCGLEYVELQVPLGLEGTGSERFRALNPNAKVPVLDDNGLIVFESVPICLYIAKRYAPDVLYVGSIEQEALVLQWSIWAMTELERHIELASLHITWLNVDERDSEIAKAGQDNVRRCLGILDRAIEGSGYLVAKRFTIADLIVCEVLTCICFARVDLGEFSGVEAYLKKNLTLDSARTAFADEVISPYLK